MGRSAAIVVIGMGNDHRQDDRCGLEVVRALRRRADLAADCHELGDDATELIDLWDGADVAYVIDAVRTGGPPGAVRRWEVAPGGGELPESGPTSTHALSLHAAVGLGRSVGRMPNRLVVYGIEGAMFDRGSDLSLAAAAGVEETVRQLTEELASEGGRSDA